MNVILKNLFNCNINKKYKFLVLVFTLFMINIGVYADELIESEYNNFLENNQEQAQTLNTSEEFSNIENYNQMKYGWQYIYGKKYFFDTNGKMKVGFQEIEGQTYFFSRVTGEMRTGMFAIDGPMYYFDETGVMQTGLQEINGKKYFFDTAGKMKVGFQEIEGQTYFFSRVTGEMRTGMFAIDGPTYYFDETVVMKTDLQEINGKKYFFDTNGKIKVGFQEIEGQTYFFSRVTGEMRTGMFAIDGSMYYFDETGKMQIGSQTINNIDYIFKDDGKLTDGWHLINNDLYYIQNGRYMTGNVWINGKTNIFTSSGIYLGIQYTPYYYMQTAGSWANVYYGSGSMKKTGCLPTSVAMALSGILGRSILPTDIASYLYYYTNEFNKITLGASGLAVQYAAKYFGVKCEGINSLSQLNDALSRGKIIVASMGTGKFAKPWYTHEIVLYNYSNGITIAYDPINSSNNGWISTYDVWNQRSFDPYDLRGGYSFYALSL